MNVVHMRYAIEVARTGSVNRASEKLLVAQPNLSRSIRELEKSLGITIFDRSVRGMILTPEGEKFIASAQRILSEMDALEQSYADINRGNRQRLSASVARASYISQAFRNFTAILEDRPTEIYFMETDNTRAIRNLVEADYGLAIVRILESDMLSYELMFREKGLVSQPFASFRPIPVVSICSPLAVAKRVTLDDLRPMTEIILSSPTEPAMHQSSAHRGGIPDLCNKRICVYSMDSVYLTTSENQNAFFWSSPNTADVLEHMGLVELDVPEIDTLCYDILLCRKDYSFTRLDKKFISCLEEERDLCFPH